MAEPPADPLSEADLSTIWAGQRFPAQALATPDGRSVRVLNPGRLNVGPGPDFRDAVIEVAGEERQGDVELHVRASAYRSHGHHLDAAYDNLALHVVYLADDGQSHTRLAGGGMAPVACLAPWLLTRTDELRGWLSSPPLWRQPCRDAGLRLGDEGLAAALGETGMARWQGRVRRLTQAGALDGEEEALWAALLDALGTGGDREGFRRLGRVFPASLASELAGDRGWGVEDRETDDAIAVLEKALLAVAGLGIAPEEVAHLLPPPLSPAVERTGRPLNWPERRLAALARFYVRAAGDLASYALRGVRDLELKPLLAAWQVGPLTPGGPALLGPERARELVLNVVLPFAATRVELTPRAQALLLQLPASAAYGKTAFLEENLVRVNGRRRVRRALEQQGLLALLEDWCRKDGCGRCPLS